LPFHCHSLPFHCHSLPFHCLPSPSDARPCGLAHDTIAIFTAVNLHTHTCICTGPHSSQSQSIHAYVPTLIVATAQGDLRLGHTSQRSHLRIATTTHTHTRTYTHTHTHTHTYTHTRTYTRTHAHTHTHTL
jgi:hypothetical protein